MVQVDCLCGRLFHDVPDGNNLSGKKQFVQGGSLDKLFVQKKFWTKCLFLDKLFIHSDHAQNRCTRQAHLIGKVAIKIRDK